MNFEEALKKYADARAASDPEFAAKYANPEKSIAECSRFIIGVARKKAAKGCTVMTDEEVWGQLVHYYDEDNAALQVPTVPRNSVVVKTPPAPKETPEQKAARKRAEAVEKKRKQDEAMGLASLFSFDETDEEGL